MSTDTERPVFSDAQERALACVLDGLIPPDREADLPGAGELGLVAAIAEAVRQSPDLEPAVVHGLAALEEAASHRGAAGFAALPAAERTALLNEIATTQPAFLPGLVFHGYVAYYQHPRVLEALGIEPRPPFPKGYDLGSTDFSLLDGVRARPHLYRDA